MKVFSGLKILSFLLITTIFSACAVDRPPSGGPPDMTPLTVISSVPRSGAVNEQVQVIRLEFSHHIRKDELKKSIFFSPAIPGYRISVHGKQAVISLDTPLKPDTSLTLTLRTPLASIYGAHRLEQSWSLSFSSGANIRQESIEGRVWSHDLEPARGVTVMAWATTSGSGVPTDSAKTTRPDYISHTGPSGNFTLQNVAPGKYRLIAITDSNGNLQPDIRSESFAVSPVPLIDAGNKDIALRLSTDSLEQPSLQRCRTINNREIEITFNRAVPTRSLQQNRIRIESTGNGKPLPLLACFSPARKSEDTVFRLLTDPMDGRAWYRVLATADSSKIVPSELTFPGNAHEERYPALSVRIVPPDGSSDIIPETIRPEAGASAELQFNLPVTKASLSQAVTLGTTSNQTERPVPFTIMATDSRTFAIQPTGGFRPGEDYRLTVNTGKLVSPVGSAPEKKIEESRFSTAGANAYGEITGTGSSQAPLVLLEARRIGTKTTVQRLSIKPVNGSFGFTFRNLPPGAYTVFGFSPSLTTPTAPGTRWNGGTIEPYVASDPFAAKSIEVRPGWSTEKIVLDIPATRQETKKPVRPANTHQQ